MTIEQLKTKIIANSIIAIIYIIIGIIMFGWEFIMLAYLIWALTGFEKDLGEYIAQYIHLKKYIKENND